MKKYSLAPFIRTILLSYPSPIPKHLRFTTVNNLITGLLSNRGRVKVATELNAQYSSGPLAAH